MTCTVLVEVPAHAVTNFRYISDDGDNWRVRYPNGEESPAHTWLVLGTVLNALRQPNLYRLSLDGQLISGSSDDAAFEREPGR